MVPKVAVIALVGILAVPILLGYALNLEQVTETDYRTTDDTVNVTPLLQNSVIYTNTAANDYQINSNFYNNNNTKIIPIYNRIVSTKSSIPLVETLYTNQSWTGATQSTDFDLFYEQFDYNSNTARHSAALYGLNSGGTESLITTVNYVKSIYFDKSTGYYAYTSYNNNNNSGTAQLTRIVLNSQQGTTDVYLATSSTSRFVDLSAGYYIKDSQQNSSNSIKLPDGTKSFVMTINLDSITASNYSQGFHIKSATGTSLIGFDLIKTTSGGVVSWKATQYWSSITKDLYYDPSRNDNTYQLYVELGDKVKVSETQNSVDTKMSLKYIGGWPTAIGTANSFMSYDFTYTGYSGISAPNYDMISTIEITSSVVRTTTIRMDAAIISGYEVPVIADKTYEPGSFKENPSTTIADVTKYGSSFTFGGNTYTVSNGNITMGNHEIPVKGLVLSSAPVSGGYENKIGDTVISTTATPSAITFNGKWSASITTTAQEEYEYTRTEWVAGEFAWNGLDQNFLMVGLLTSLGAFIALGIYARRSKASIWPLLVVCGGAALIFFVML